MPQHACPFLQQAPRIEIRAQLCIGEEDSRRLRVRIKPKRGTADRITRIQRRQGIRAGKRTKCHASPGSYQALVPFTSRTTDSITGTSTSTPTTVASAAPRFDAEQAHRGRDCQLEEMGRADQRGRRRNAPGDAEPAAEPLRETGVK